MCNDGAKQRWLIHVAPTVFLKSVFSHLFYKCHAESANIYTTLWKNKQGFSDRMTITETLQPRRQYKMLAVNISAVLRYIQICTCKIVKYYIDKSTRKWHITFTVHVWLWQASDGSVRMFHYF